MSYSDDNDAPNYCPGCNERHHGSVCEFCDRCGWCCPGAHDMAACPKWQRSQDRDMFVQVRARDPFQNQRPCWLQ